MVMCRRPAACDVGVAMSEQTEGWGAAQSVWTWCSSEKDSKLSMEFCSQPAKCEESALLMAPLFEHFWLGI